MARRAGHLLGIGGIMLAGACENGGIARENPSDPTAVSPAGATTTYRLVVTDAVSGAGSAQQRDLLRGVQAALAAKGMREAAPGATADLAVTLDYRLGLAHPGPVDESVPIFEVTPGKEVDQVVATGIGPNGSTILEMRKVKEPDIETYMGERPVTVIRRVYEKRVRISARAGGNGPDVRPAREIWSLEMICEGISRDPKVLLRVLAGPGRAFLGNEADGPMVLRIDEDKVAIESVERVL